MLAEAVLQKGLWMARPPFCDLSLNFYEFL